MNIHPLADVQGAVIGEHTNVWQFTVILPGAVIGSNCNICAQVFIEGDVVIGDNVTIKNGVYVWNGVRMEDNVFIGPSVVFTNDLLPRSKRHGLYGTTLIQKGASLGANTTVLTGITVGAYAMSGIGSVLTRHVPAHALVYGNPARQHGWVDEQGRKLKQQSAGTWVSEDGIVYRQTEQGLEKL